MHVYPDAMLLNLAKTHGLIFSQRVLVELMKKGLARDSAYTLVQRAAMKTWAEGTHFRDNLNADKEVARHLSNTELDRIFDLDYYLRNVPGIFKRLKL